MCALVAIDALKQMINNLISEAMYIYACWGFKVGLINEIKVVIFINSVYKTLNMKVMFNCWKVLDCVWLLENLKTMWGKKIKMKSKKRI